MFVDGALGVGVTTLLRQLAESTNPCVALFLRTGSRIGYDPRLVLCQLVSGIAAALGDNDSDRSYDDARDELPALLARLSRRAIHSSAVTFIVDGLHQIPASDAAFRKEIIDNLPLGQPGCKFVISGRVDMFDAKVFQRLSTTPQTVPGFTLDEAKTYLSDYLLEPPVLEKIWTDAGCNPSVLASVRRFLDAGTPPEQLLRTICDDPNTVLVSEWRAAELSASDKNMLAIVAYDDGEYTVAALAEMTGGSADSVHQVVSHQRFVDVAPNGAVQFVSPFFKEFARKQLSSHRASALDAVVRRYQAAPNSDEALSVLPAYLVEMRRPTDLIAYLSAARFPAIVKASGSAAVVHQATTNAVAAAVELKNYSELVRFSVHAATVAGIHATSPPDSEVNALLALDKTEEARALAESATVAEDKLQLLAKVGRELTERGMAPDERLLKLVRDLYLEIDLRMFGERGMDLAEDLLCISPTLGLELLDKFAQLRRGDEQASWAFADLAVEATKWSKRHAFPAEGLAEIHSRINDPEAKLTAACRAATYSGASGEEIIAEARRFPRVGDGIRLVASWVTANKNHRDVLDVVASVLAWMTATLEIVPNARVLRQLASALPRNEDGRLPTMVAQFDVLKSVAESLGPSIEYVRLQCALAHAEWGYNRQDASNRLMSAALFAAELTDPASRAGSFAAIASKLAVMDPERVLDVHDKLHEMASTEVIRSIDETLASTAEPHLTLAETLRSLGQHDVALAIATARRFNSVERTDTGLLNVSFAASMTRSTALSAVARVTKHMLNSELRDVALMVPLTMLFERNELTMEEQKYAAEMLQCIGNEGSALTLARALLLSRKHNVGDSAVFAERLVAWDQAAEPTCEAVERRFEMAAMLAKVAPVEANLLFDRAIEVRRGLAFSNARRGETYELSVRLAVKALEGLFKGGRESEQNMLDLANVIADVPSRISRIRYWVDVALGFAREGRGDECRKIREKYIRPLLEETRVQPGNRYGSAIVEALPALFQCHGPSALQEIRSLMQPEKDRAVLAVAHFILNKVGPHEPCASPLDGVYDLSYESVVDLLDLAELVERDSSCFQIAKAVCSSMNSTKYRQYTREQKAQTSVRVQRIANEKFPAPGYISHDGYAIVTRAQALQLVSSSRLDWEPLALQARAVNNAADVPLILMLLATCMPSSLAKLKDDIFAEARDRVERLASVHDRLQRLVDLANSLRRTNRGSAKRAVRAAIALLQSSKEGAMPSKGLIDAVHRIDPEAAEVLAAIHDKDPARAELRKTMRRHLDAMKASESLNDLSFEDERGEMAADAAWLALANLNAGHASALPSDRIWKLIEQAGKWPIQESFPILSLAMTAAARRFAGTDQSATLLRAIFDGAVVASRVVRDISAETKERGRSLDRGAHDLAVLVRVGERAKAMAWLEEWCSRHVTEELVVCDPYFSLADLECVRLVQGIVPAARVRVITSRAALKNVAQPWEETFRDHWSQVVSTSQAPDAEILVVGVAPNGKSPIHDRWWIAGSSGLRLGTSFNGLGARDSELSVLTPEQSAEVRALLNFYLRRERSAARDVRVEYSMFSL